MRLMTERAEMGFLEPLDELRIPLIRSCVAIGAGLLLFIASAIFERGRRHYARTVSEARRQWRWPV